MSGEKEIKETPQQAFNNMSTAVDELRDVVRKALLPALDNLRTQLNEFNRKMDEYRK